MNHWISMMNSAFVVAAMMSVLTMICAPDACAGKDARRARRVEAMRGLLVERALIAPVGHPALDPAPQRPGPEAS